MTEDKQEIFRLKEVSFGYKQHRIADDYMAVTVHLLVEPINDKEEETNNERAS